MPFFAKIYRVLVSCPSDVREVRDAAVQIINEWNYAHSGERTLFLEAVTWESHVAPALGRTAQTIINEEIVADCDVLVGIFWTRFGTPTERFASGTEEEIESFVKEGKEVMLYFSDAPASPSTIDPQQWRRVQKFKEDSSKRGLYKTFDRLDDFKLKFKNHLEQKVHQLTERQVADNYGLLDARLMWNSNVPDDFILSQSNLLMLFKDGFSFFSSRAGVLRKRLAKARASTTILLLHPDYRHMGGVADMDPQKRGNPGRQRQDCLDTIRTMHRLRSEILATTGSDIAGRVGFIGYRSVPTWNGMLGASRSFITLYPTHSHRGELITLDISNYLEEGLRSFWFERYMTDFEELVRAAKSEQEEWDLWRFALS
jgi:hypothetical protein